jgi:hypothetical protein
MPWGITALPCSCGKWIQEPGPPGWESLKNRDNKICPWVPWESDLRKAALSVPSKNLKIQTRLLVREGAPHQQIRNCLKIIKERRRTLGRGPRWVPDTRQTDRLTVSRNIILTLTLSSQWVGWLANELITGLLELNHCGLLLLELLA